MKTDLDKSLCEAYPKIFKDRHAPVTQTAMCWGFECGDGWYDLIDSLCGSIQNHIENTRRERAYALRYNRALKQAKAGNMSSLIKYFDFGVVEDSLERAKARAQKAIDDGEEFRTLHPACQQVVATQIKEKFGGLRFYYFGGDAVVDGMVRVAEHLSYRLCEVCGSPGKIRGEHWISTRCEQHCDKREY